MSKIDIIEKSRGRYFGLATTQGNKLNARYVGSTNDYIRVYDRNKDQQVKLAKTSVASVSYGGETFR